MGQGSLVPLVKIDATAHPHAGVVNNLQKRLVRAGIIFHERIVVHGGEIPLFPVMVLQSLHIGALGADHIGLGHAGGEGGPLAYECGLPDAE